MRLKDKEIKIIKDTINSFLNDVKIYLFGSRLNANKKGGDIDLFIISNDINYETKIKIKAKLKQLLQKPVDIVYHQDFNREIEKEALKGVLL
jgi:predicted nucleotidyltransferase